MQEAVQIAAAIQAERASAKALRQEAMQSMQQKQHDMALQLEAANSRVNRSVHCLPPRPLFPHQAESTQLLCAEQQFTTPCLPLVMHDNACLICSGHLQELSAL